MSGFEHGTMTWAMLGLLALLAAVGGLFFALIYQSRKRDARNSQPDFVPSGVAASRQTGPFRPLFYQQPTRWLAVRSSDARSVERALGLNNTAQCSWEEGLARSGDRAVFITPSVIGWVLAIGPGLPDPDEDIDECYHFLVQLSRKVGEVHYFSFHPALQHHAWARLNGGRVERAYAWSDETLWNQGSRTRAETELGLTCFDYGERQANTIGSVEAAGANVDKIPALAARWSINPAGIDERILDHGGGIVGESSRVRPC